MSTNWKTYVEKTNAKTYVLPDGWDSRETVAEQLGCSPEKVNDHLRPGLSAGEIEKAQFPVWSSTLQRKIMVWAYRKAQAQQAEKPSEPKSANVDGAQVAKLKAQGLTWPQVGERLGVHPEVARTAYRRAHGASCR